MKTDRLNSIVLRQFRAEELLSYVLFDRKGGRGLLIDPLLSQIEDYRHYLQENSIKSIELFYTQASPDRDLVSQRLSIVQFKEYSLGDRLQLGDIEFRVVEGPLGRTPSFILLSPDLIFTGQGFLLDRPNPSESRFSQLLRDLPETALLFPGSESDGVLFSTVKKELAHFARSENPQKFSSISIDKYKNKLHEKDREILFLDVREKEEFEKGHIPGTVNMPLSELGLHWSELAQRNRIYISCQAGRRSVMAAKTLAYLGAHHVVNVIGGYQGWINAGYPSSR